MTCGGAGGRQAFEPRARDAGDAALLLELDPVIELEVNARAIALAGALQGASLKGVRDVIPTFRSVAVYFDPLVIEVEVLRAAIARASHVPATVTAGRVIHLPVVYGGTNGPDLSEVAAFAGLTPEQVIERHAGREYRVFMLGFLPGFAYMGTVAPAIAAPRRAAPRLRVPAGSVGIAGAQTAVYPCDSPGGWQIIGRTPTRLFDPGNSPAAVLSPGDSVRFVPAADGGHTEAAPPAAKEPTARPRPAGAAPHGAGRHVTVLEAGLLTTVQDEGRWGGLSSGVPVSGAMDPVAHRVANALVGNGRDAATLEVTLVGPALRIEADATLAIAGADLGATLNGAPVPVNRAVRARAGDVLRFGPRRRGTRAYLGIDGGVAVPPVLGSRATHVLTGLGGLHGRALASGDRLPLGAATLAPRQRSVDVPPSPASGGGRVRVMPGPQEEWFPAETLEILQRSRFTVTPESNRMGYRLAGARLPRTAQGEMISDATFTGAIQVPPSGDPILLMVDRQTTGGYPQIATVITADLPVAAQLAPGDWIEFQICSRAEALAALVAQEGKLLALG